MARKRRLRTQRTLKSSFKLSEPGLRTTRISLAVLALLIVLLRLHTYEEPFERDLNYYAVIAHEMVHGQHLYTEVADHKPPAPHLTYAFAEVLVGYGKQQMYFLGVLAATLTLLGLYCAGRAVSGRRSVGLVAAACWAIICHDLRLQANQPNTEVFINASVVWGVALWFGLRGPSMQWRRVIGIGLLFLWASFYKHVAVTIPAVIGLAYIAWPGPELSRRQAVLQVGGVAGVGVAGWSLLIGYFAVRGGLEPFIDQVFLVNQHYSSGMWNNILKGLSPTIFFRGAILKLLPCLFVAGLAAMFLPQLAGQRRSWAIYLSWAVATFVAVSLPGKYYPHYYQFWLPLIALGFGLLVWSVLQFRSWKRWAGIGLILIAGMLTTVHELSFFLLSAEEWSLNKYRDGMYVQSRSLGLKLNEILEGEETFFEWGGEPGLYFNSQRRPVTGVVAAFMALPGFVGEHTAEKLTQRTMQDLERARPDLIVVSEQMAAWTHESHPFIRWFTPRYTAFDKYGQFVLFARRGSRLEARHVQVSAGD